jgi:hypothetical protein
MPEESKCLGAHRKYGMTDRLEVSTDVYVPPGDAYEFLVDFPQYARYSEYLETVDQYGDGTSGTEYDLTLSWWRLSYVARSRVTDLDPPTRIDWELLEDVDAAGSWVVEPLPDPDPPDGHGTLADGESGSRVRLVAEVDVGSADRRALELPRYLSVDRVVDRVKPTVTAEAERVVERIVADLEGTRRDIELRVHETPL